MDLWLEKFLAKSTTVTVFSDVDTPTPGFTTTTVTQAKEELGPGWAVDDVYPPLAELRRALLTDEEWAAMSSWDKDVWEMYYMPDWERLACIEQILVDTPAAQRAHRHEEILAALHSLGASTLISVDHLDDSHVVSVDAALSAIVEEGPEYVHSASTSVITIVPFTCSTLCLPQHPMAVPLLVASSPPTPNEYSLDTNIIPVAAMPLSMSQCIASKVYVHRPMPWPSFSDGCATGDETRPLPWPSFSVSCDCESLPDVTMKPSRHCSCDHFPATPCVVIMFSSTTSYGNLSTSTDCIIIYYPCNSSERIRFNGLPLFLEHSGFVSDYVQQALVWHTCTIFGFLWPVMVRSLELKLLSIGSAFFMLSTVLVDSSDVAALTYEFLGVDTTAGIPSWLVVVTIWLPCAQEPGHYVCSSELKESEVLIVVRSSSHSVLCDEWVLSAWDPGQQSLYFDPTLLTPQKPGSATRHLHGTIILTDCGNPFSAIVVLHVETHCKNRKFVYYGALLLPIWYAALKYMDFYWLTNTIFPEVSRAWFSLQIGVTGGELTSLVICNSSLQNHQDTTHMQMQTGYLMQRSVTCSVHTILLLTHVSELSIFMLGGGQGILQGGRHMSVLDRANVFQLPWDPSGSVAAWRQAEFQGGRGALDSAICYLLHENDIDFLHSLNFNGLKVMQVPWDPGGSQLLGSSTTTTWGQAVFQGGRGVSNPLHIMGRHCGPWANHHHTWLLGRTIYKYTQRSNGEGIQVGSGNPTAAATSSPTWL